MEKSEKTRKAPQRFKSGDKVISELGRPTFRKIGLDDYCRFISTEALADLVKKAKGIGGHMQPSVLDSIAEALEEEDDQEF